MHRPIRRQLIDASIAPLGGLLVAASMPPWGWWPCSFVGVALWEYSLRGRATVVRWRRSAAFSLAWLAPSVSWMWQFTVAGFVIVIVVALWMRRSARGVAAVAATLNRPEAAAVAAEVAVFWADWARRVAE